MLQDKKQAELLKNTQKAYFKAVFGTPYIAHIIAVALVAVSLILAVFISYDGLFTTAASEGMTNYHRWLYDVFVFVGIAMGPVLYILMRLQLRERGGRQAWREYTRAHAQFKMNRYHKAQAEGKKTLLNSWVSEAAVFIMIIAVFILMYSVITPNESDRRSDFWIQTWWPINAVLIGLIYYGIFCLYIRLFAVMEVESQYQLLKTQEQRTLRKK